MKCAGCMDNITDNNASIVCTAADCEEAFCMLCVDLSSLTVARKELWKCPPCSAKEKKGKDNSLTPVRTDSVNITTRKKINSTGSEVSQLTEQLRILTSELTSVKNKLEDLTVSISYTNDKMEDMMLKLAASDERLKYLEKRDVEVQTLQATVMQLQQELKTQAQYNLRNEMEIVGIPENQTENLYHTVLVAAGKLGVELDERDIDWVTRVGPHQPPVTTSLPEDRGKMPRPVVVRLLRRSKRDQLLKAGKSRRNITSADLLVSGSTQRVFFNDRLTRDNRVLFRITRSRAKQLAYSYCWCSQGTIFVRQREGGSAVRIQSQKDLDRLLPPPSNTNSQEHIVSIPK